MAQQPQSDPWAEAAKSYRPSGDAPKASSSDDWKIWQGGNEQDNRNSIQKSFDTNTQDNPNDSMLKTGLKSVVGAVGAPFVHPMDTLKNMIPTSVNMDDMKNQFDTVQAHPGHEIAKAAGGLLGGGLLAGATGGMAKGVMDAIPSTARAGESLENLNAALKNQPVTLNKTLAPLQRATEIGVRGGGGLPTPVSQFLERTQATEPMTFPEARDYQSGLTDLSHAATREMGKRMKGGIGQINKSFYDDMRAAAEAQGKGDEFDSAMTEYRRASQLRDLGKQAAKYAIPAAGAGVAGKIGYDLIK